LIQVIDKRNEDFLNFGIPIISKIAAWILGVDLEDYHLTNGTIYVSNDV